VAAPHRLRRALPPWAPKAEPAEMQEGAVAAGVFGPEEVAVAVQRTHWKELGHACFGVHL
jgi:hypothetical protein